MNTQVITRQRCQVRRDCQAMTSLGIRLPRQMGREDIVPACPACIGIVHAQKARVTK